MPIFEYKCKKCNHNFEEFVFSSATSSDELPCPVCGEIGAEKLMSSFCSSSGSSSSDFSAHTNPCGRSGFR